MKLSIQWPLVLFTLISGTGGGIYLFSVLPIALGGSAPQALFVTSIIAMILIVIGGICSVFHLKQIGNSFNVVKHLFSFSGISIEIIMLGITFVLVAASMYMGLTGFNPLAQRVVAVVGIVFALLMGYFCGHGYVMPGRPEWQTNFLPLAYCGTVMAAGGFLFEVIQVAVGSSAAEIAFSAPWCVVAAVLCAVVCAGYSVRVRTAVFNADEVGINVQADIDRSAEEARVRKAKRIYALGLVACGIPAVLVCAVVQLLFPAAVLPIAVLGVLLALSAGLSVRTLMWEVGRCYLPLFDLCDIGITV